MLRTLKWFALPCLALPCLALPCFHVKMTHNGLFFFNRHNGHWQNLKKKRHWNLLLPNGVFLQQMTQFAQKRPSTCRWGHTCCMACKKKCNYIYSTPDSKTLPNRKTNDDTTENKSHHNKHHEQNMTKPMMSQWCTFNTWFEPPV
jgi:hypothetical protein